MAQDAEFDRQGRDHEMQRGMAQEFRTLRTQAGISQAEASALAGLHINSVRRFERGEGDIYLSSLVRLCEAIGKPAWKVLRHVERGPQCIVATTESAQVVGQPVA